MEELSKSFTIIRLGGRHLGFVAGMEQRAAVPGYSRMVDCLFEELAIADGEEILEVGTCSGVLSRQLAARTNGRNRIIASDINAFFLDEARYLADQTDFSSAIQFRVADAESLPFENESVDVIWSVTTYEECDADTAIAEMHRVLRPGGRAGVVVRALDLQSYWNIDAPDELVQSLGAGGGVSALGCADRSLYERFGRHFSNLRPYTYWWTAAPPMLTAVTAALASLGKDEKEVLTDALEVGTQKGTAFLSRPLHCVVGTKQ